MELPNVKMILLLFIVLYELLTLRDFTLEVFLFFKEIEMKSVYRLLVLASIICLHLQIKIESKVGAEIMNPDIGTNSSGGGASGEFLRKHQPQEHLFVPVLNTMSGDYNPYFDTNIKEFRKKYLKIDPQLKYERLINQQKVNLLPGYASVINKDQGIDPDVSSLFKGF